MYVASAFCTSNKGVSETDCQVASVLTTCFHTKMIGLVLCGVLVASNSLKTMATDKIYQRIDYYCTYVNLHTEFNLPATRPYYLLNFGSEKVGPRTIILALCIYHKAHFSSC